MGDTIVIETPVATVLEVSGLQGPQGPTGPQGPSGEASGSLPWTSITGKPSTFTPSSHTHVAADVTDFASAVVAAAPPTTNASLLTSGTLADARLSAAVTTSLGKADTASQPGHTHAVSDVTGLQTALDGKQASGSYAAASHTHTPSEVGLGNVSNTAQVTSVSGTAPIVSSGGTTPVISVTTGSTAGTVAAGDHTHTNFSSLRIDPANGSMGSLVVGNTTSGQNNYVTIDNKIRLLSPSNSFVASLDAAALSENRTISLPDAAGTLALTSDITKTAVGLGNVSNTAQVTSVSGTAPIVSSGGTTPAISLQNSPTLTGDVRVNGATAGVTGSLQVGSTTGSFARDVELNGGGLVLRNIGASGVVTIARAAHGTFNYTLTPPAASGTIALTSDIPSTFAASAITSGVFDNARINFAAPSAIGSTTASSGAFTTLTANNGTLTASAPALTVSQTWNNSGVTFSALDINVTNTASLGDSALIKATIGGTTVFQFRRDYRLLLSPSGSDALIQAGGVDWIVGRYNGTTSIAAPTIRFNTGNSTILEVGTADTIEMRRTTNPQTFRLYNTFTDASNYERGFMRWSSNVLEIGSEALGTGSSRNVAFFRGGARQFTLIGSGALQLESTGQLSWASRGAILMSADGVMWLSNNAGTDFGRFAFGGTTSSFPALKRSSTALQVRLADDSADAPFSSGAITTSGTVTANNTSSGFVTSSAPNGASPVRFAANSGDVLIQSANAAGIVEFRGTTGTNPQSLRVFNTFTSGTSFERLNIRWASNECIIDAEAGSGGGTLRGIKIGSATSSLLGFYGVTPVDQPATVADPAGGGTIDAEARTAINAIIDRLQELGLIA